MNNIERIDKMAKNYAEIVDMIFTESDKDYFILSLITSINNKKIQRIKDLKVYGGKQNMALDGLKRFNELLFGEKERTESELREYFKSILF